MNVKGGTEMTDEELAAAGANKSYDSCRFHVWIKTDAYRRYLPGWKYSNCI